MSPATGGLTIAVPRGALFGGTVDLLAGLGIDTDELRSNDRKLLFEDIGVITMRPSDVPTYVEAGAADLGVTGKDVLLEQAAQRAGRGGREVYVLLDLGYGRCTMVLASKAGPDPALGTPIGGGGRYDELLGRFGRSLPAVGFAWGVDRLHIALAGEERGARLDTGQAVATPVATSQ